jgi:hypothetical protein
LRQYAFSAFVSVAMERTPGRVHSRRLAEHDRREAVVRLAMLDGAIAAHRRLRHFAVVRRLLTARSAIYRTVLELNARVVREGGEPLARRRFERRRYP